jgi:uncharacterized delta-60 repeat protein
MFHQSRQSTGLFIVRRPAALWKLTRTVLALAMTASLFSFGLSKTARADNCALDPAFGNGGKVITDFGDREAANAAALQEDGKIVAAGGAFIGIGDRNFALARYNPDGRLDTTFGSGGKVITDFLGYSDEASGIVIQPDHKIIAAGTIYTDNGSSITDFGLARYNSDGSLDDGTANDSTPGDSFGNGGKVITDFFGSADGISDVALQSDGKIIAVGNTRVSFSVFTDFALARYNPDGQLDNTFGNGGKVTLDFSGNPDGASTITIQPTDGKIIVGGAASLTAPFRTDFALVRYNTDGQLDDTFGSGGIVTTDYNGGDDGIVDTALQTDGRIVTVGYTQFQGPAKFALARYNPNGHLDNTFGDHGQVVTVFPEAYYGNAARSVALQPGDGKIVVGGWIARNNIPAQNNESFALARYLTNGQLDPSFDGDGRTITDFRGTEDEANAVLIQPDGNIVAVGFSAYDHYGYFSFALARYLGDAADYAPTLDSVTLATNRLPGGGYLSGTVKLCGPAPAGGVKVMLTDTLDAAHVQSTVTVPEGQTTATFLMTTKSVLKTEAGNVIAQLGTTRRVAPLVIQAIGIFYLALEPNPVEGPHQAQGAVVLNGRAPEGGITVTLSSKNPAVASPTVSTIFIPAGMQQKNFTIRTSDVPSPHSALIMATANGTSKSRVLTVN